MKNRRLVQVVLFAGLVSLKGFAFIFVLTASSEKLLAASVGEIASENLPSVICEDTFTANGSLAGRSVETGTGTWIADSTLATSAGVALPGATDSGKHALLPFVPRAGKVYELSADLNLESGSSFLSMGFCADNDMPNGAQLFIQYEDSEAPWMYVATNGTIATLTGPKGGGYEGFSGMGTVGKAKIVLDTTGSDWRAVWSFDGNTLRTNVFSGSLNITHVAFGGANLSATVDNFLLKTDLAVLFNTPGDFEGWDDLHNVENVSVSGGVLQGTTVTADPFIFNDALTVDADSIEKVYVRLKADQTGGSQFYWKIGSTYYQQTLSYTETNEWQVLSFDVGNHPNWSGLLNYLRIDPVAAIGTDFQVDWIIGSDGDFDDDWIDDEVEGFSDFDGDGLENFRDGDSDGDGTGDKEERLNDRDPLDASDMAFQFNRDDDFEAWVPGNGVTNATVSDGILSGVSTTIDPCIYNTDLTVDSDAISAIYVRLFANDPGRSVLYWKHDGQQEQLGKDYTNAGNWQVMCFDVGNHMGWAGTVDFLRVDPFLTANDAFAIDWIIASDGDLDNDGIADVTDGLYEDADGDGLENFRDVDSDGDGIRDGAHTFYYVSSSNGNNQWDGLAPAYEGGSRGPWQTLQRADNTVFAPGDVLLLERDSVFQGPVTLQGSGETDNPCTVLPYGSGARPVIENSGTGLMFVDDAWEIRGLEIRNCSVGIYLPWRERTDWEYFRFDDLYMHHITPAFAIHWSTTGNTNLEQTIFRDIRVTDSRFEYNEKGWGGYTTVENASRHTFNDLVFDGCTFVSNNGPDAVALQFVTYGSVRNCYVEGCGDTDHATAGVLLQSAKYSSVIHTDIIGTKRYGDLFDGQGIDFEGNCSDCLVDDVYIADCDGAAILFFKNGGSHRNLEVRNCIFYNNSLNPHPNQAYYDLIFYGQSTGDIHHNIWQHRPGVEFAGVDAEDYAGFDFHNNYESLSVIYQDSFSTDGSLAGRAVEMGSGTWQTHTDMLTSDGAAWPAESSSAKVAALPFAPEVGEVYVLSADIHATGGSWVALGFLSETDVSIISGDAYFFQHVDEESPWMYTQPNSVVHTFVGPSAGGDVNQGSLGSAGTLKIELDTREPDWRAVWYFNDTAIRTNTYSGSLDISHVAFGANPISEAEVDNFMLKSVLPWE